MEYILTFFSMPFFITENYLLITALIPAFSATIIFFVRKYSRLTSIITIISSILLFIYVCFCTLCWTYSDYSQFILIDFGNNLHISLKLEFIGVIFSLLISFLWTLTSIYTVFYMKKNYSSNNYSNFLCFILATISCVIFIAFSGDLFTTFIFYELLTITTYPLVTYNATNESMIAGRYYFGTLFFSSLTLFFPLLGFLYSEFHTLDFISNGIFKYNTSLIFTSICFIMLIYGVGKTALMPIHFWLPKVMIAPTPVSALLHAVAVVKSGVFIIIKAILYIFGTNNLQCLVQQSWLPGGWLPYLTGFTVIIASLIALGQKELKKLLAYSTISQLSYIILFASIFSDLSIKVAVFQLVCHSFEKITLFFVAGNIITKTGEKYVNRIHGIGRSMPVTMFAFTIGALSMIGIPPAPTFWGKFFIFQAVFNTGNIILFVFIAFILIINTILNAMCFLPIIYVAFFSKPSRNFPFNKRISIFLVLPLVVTTICTFILFFLAIKLF
ncbi:MAG: cation:proton antiporter [Wolbachia endosymbiont of Menacanthus eurysternus]|nr:MAG: cation:proton antiporter [Wolbachia endosymbiont of Menacanthus eurysternus]